MRKVLTSIALSLPVLATVAGAQAGSAPSDGAAVILLKLSDSRVLWGEIVGHDADRLSFQRIDTGGTVHVPWSMLEAGQANHYQEQFGYVDHSGEELMVEAERLTLVDGTEIIGKVINRTPNELYVKTSTSLIPVPLMRLRGTIVPVQVPALDVYTREELYQSELANLDLTSAESQFLMGSYCEQILDFTHAIEHYKAAGDLDTEYKANELPQFIAKAERKAENQSQLDHLYEVDSLRARRKYDAAMLHLDQFEEMYPDNDLSQDVHKKRAQIVKAREQALARQVPISFYAWTQRLLAKVARDKSMTFTSSLEYVEEALTEDVFTAVHAEMQRLIGESVTGDEVRKHWQVRERRRVRKSSYGQGTWLLGDDKARADFKTREAPKVDTKKDAERAKLEEKLKRYMANQEMVKRAKASADQESEHEAFWGGWRSTYRGLWMLAYYAEYGGELQVRKPVQFRNCPDCNGSAIREIINTGSARTGASGANSQIIQCPLCMGVGVQRRVAFW